MQAIPQLADDTTKVDAFFDLAATLYRTDHQQAIAYLQQGVALGNNLQAEKRVLYGTMKLGFVHYRHGEYKQAREQYARAVKQAEEQQNAKLYADALDMLGMSFNYLGQHGQASDYCLRALVVRDTLGDQKRVAKSYNNLSIILKNQKQYDEAYEYAKKSLKTRETIKDTNGVAASCHNIGTILQRKNDYDQALIYYFKALELNRKSGNEKWMSYNYNNIGNVYQSMHDFNKAIRFHTKAQAFKESVGDRHGMAIGLLNLGEDHQMVGDGQTALNYLNQSLELCRTLENHELESSVWRLRAKAYALLNRHKEAYEAVNRYQSIQDSLDQGPSMLDLSEIATIYRSEAKEKEIELLREKEVVAATKLELRDITILASTFLMVLLIIVTIITFRNFQQKKRSNQRLYEQNEAIKKQQEKIKIQQQEILEKNRMLEKNNQELTEAVQKMKEASMAKARFLSTMSHEIRTPLNAILGMAHLLLEEQKPDDNRDHLNIINFSAKNLLSLVNDILDFSKIEAGKVDFEVRDFNLRELVNNSVESFRLSADDKHLHLGWTVNDDVPPVVTADSVRLSQILINLLGNAVKFTEEGSVKIRVKRKKKQDDRVVLVFEVEDTGIGIPYEEQENIFEQFTQAETDTTRKFGGSGLGLTIAKQLVDLQGGKLTLVSIPGVGSTFSFQLPIQIPSIDAPGSDKPMIIQKDALKNKKVLLVEDNVINQRVTMNFLEKWGVKVEVAGQGKEALNSFQKRHFDLILLDLRMPGIDGFEVAKRIRAMTDSSKKNVPIIALSASAMLEVRDQVFEVGMNDYLSKPFDPDDLFSKLKKWIE